MKKIIILALLFLHQNAYTHSSHDWRTDYQGYLSVMYELPFKSHSPIVKKTSKRISQDFFKQKLTQFTQTPDRKDAANLDVARSFLKEEYEKIGFQVDMQPFGTGINFIAEKKGLTNPDKILILSSHIDTVRCKGANDNGTGTIGLLAVAKELAKKNYDYTIRILGFDREEVGLVGSDAYVASITDKKNIIGNINFEMMGVNSRRDGSFHVIDCQKTNSIFITNQIRNSINTLGPQLSIVKACTDRSDHASFWRNNLPAVVISENFFGGDADPCYHSRCDIVDERLNFNYMGNILEAVLDASENILTIQNN